MDRTDTVVIGGGVIGCAVAERIVRGGREVVLVEAEHDVAQGITSRNSGVVHAGIYYRPGSLKAQSCVRGNRLLYEWCQERNVPFSKTGKLIVAKEKAEVEALERLYETAKQNGAVGVSLITEREVKQREPSLDAQAALFSSESGVVDPVEFTRSLRAAAEEHGLTYVSGAEVYGITRTGAEYWLETSRGDISAAQVVNAAGLRSDEVAEMVGVEKFRIYPCRGDYFWLRSEVAYRHLIYPVKRPKDTGLGVHLTIDIEGRYRLGPDTEYVEEKSTFAPAEEKLPKFLRAAQKLLGPLQAAQLSYDSCGIRPKLRGPEDREEKDFAVEMIPEGFLHLVGIESPGLTSALALAEHAGELLSDRV